MNAKEEITGAVIRSARNAGMPLHGPAVLAISVINTQNNENLIAYAQSETDSWDGGYATIFQAFDKAGHEFIIAVKLGAASQCGNHAVANQFQALIIEWLITIDLHVLAGNK